MHFQHRFVDFIPKELESGILYVAPDFGAVVHLCACGCGNEAVTPLSRTDWFITFDGESISLSPSVGNWSFPCQSHYFITRNQVRWAPKWTKRQIEEGRKRDRALKNDMPPKLQATAESTEYRSQSIESWWHKLLRKLTG